MTEKTENQKNGEETTEKKVKDTEVEKEVIKIIELKETERDVFYTPSFFDPDKKILAEQIYKDGKFLFAVANYNENKVEERNEIQLESRIYRPVEAELLMKNNVVIFPTGCTDYGTLENLVKDVRAFIYKYWDAKNPSDYDLSTYYILHSYLYDKFNEVPYLQNLGYFGSGKTRNLFTVGGLCYRATFISGALTESPLFHVIEIFRGTINIDEGDWASSDMWSSIIKILNHGYCKGMSVVKMRKGKDGILFPTPYNTYSPKILATRRSFGDKALDSRCIKLYAKDSDSIREDIPLNLTEEFYVERQNLINKLLVWRMKNYLTAKLDRSLQYEIKCSMPRLKQIMIPIISSVNNPVAREKLIDYLTQREKNLITERKNTIEYSVFEAILDFAKKGKYPTVGEIAEKVKTLSHLDLTPQRCGRIIKNALGFVTETDTDGYKRLSWKKEQLVRLGKRFGLTIN